MSKKLKNSESLTNESIKKSFDNNFKMAIHIMNVARNYQSTGREFTLNSLMNDVQKSVEKQRMYQEQLRINND
jgi:hypothetical protein